MHNELLSNPNWIDLKSAVAELQTLEIQDGSIPHAKDHAIARGLVKRVTDALVVFRGLLPHDAAYLDAAIVDFERWVDESFGVPDFYDSLLAFRPELNRTDGVAHLVVFPM
jgi:Family of unknown function (DUF6421)